MNTKTKELTTISKVDLQRYLLKAVEIAQVNGKLMRNRETNIPNGQRVLTEDEMSDIKSGAALNAKRLLHELGSEHHLFSYGDSEDMSEGLEWICDYIDGAYSYSFGHRISVTSVALTLNGVSQVAVVYEPWTNRLYSAVLGQGFSVDGVLVKPLSLKLEKGTLIDVEWWPWATYDVDTWLHNVSMDTHAYVLHIGCIVYGACLVASGVFGAAVLGRLMEGKNHEIAAMKLLVEEAGAVITDLRGSQITHIGNIEGLLIASSEVHAELLRRVDFL